MYMKPTQRISITDFVSWMAAKGAEAQHICRAFEELMNVEFHRAWGEPGVAGSDADIVHACRLFAEMCESALRWEEEVRFVRADDAFDDVLNLYIGIVGATIDEAAKLPAFLGQSFGDDVKPGEYRLSLSLTLPDGWSDDVSAALERATEHLLGDVERPTHGTT
jgi:hypothetical protein